MIILLAFITLIITITKFLKVAMILEIVILQLKLKKILLILIKKLKA